MISKDVQFQENIIPFHSVNKNQTLNDPFPNTVNPQPASNSINLPFLHLLVMTSTRSLTVHFQIPINSTQILRRSTKTLRLPPHFKVVSLHTTIKLSNFLNGGKQCKMN